MRAREREEVYAARCSEEKEPVAFIVQGQHTRAVLATSSEFGPPPLPPAPAPPPRASFLLALSSLLFFPSYT